MIFHIFIFFVLIFFSAFFSASETAIFSLSKVALRNLQERTPKAKIIKKLLQKPTRLLSVIVFGNLLFNVGIASLSTAIFVSLWGARGLVFAIAFSGFTILFFGEIFPKIFAIYSAKKFSLPASLVLSFFLKIFFPFVVIIEKIVKYFSQRLIKIPKKKIEEGHELKTALLLGKRGGQITEEEKDLISYVLEFKDTTAGEIITARVDVKGIDFNFSQSEVLSYLRKIKHSKLPVYEESLDKIKGVVYTEDIFLNPDKDWHFFIREPFFVPESKGIDDILKLFWYKKKRFAIVLDEYGGTEGIITWEDVVEEIFGEIYDEFENIEEPVEKINQNTWRVCGKTPIKTVNIELDLNIPEQEDTLAGFLLAQAKKIPKTGETFQFIFTKTSNHQKVKVDFNIERATARRIVSIAIRIKDKGQSK